MMPPGIHCDQSAQAEERQYVVMKRFGLVLLLACACAGAASALNREQQHGQELLITLCARCHAVGETGRSPHIDAPAFRTFSDRKLYDEDFSQRLQSGLSTIHPDMPTFRFNRNDAEAAVNYLKAIQDRSKPK
jgi:mono/diheme cytochrome c family protein